MNSVVLVTIDSMRADSWGFLSGSDLTPTLDSLAAEGLGFEAAVAPGPSTPESMPAVMTGTYPTDVDRSAHSQLRARRDAIRHHLTARETVAERFRRLGYATAGFSPNPYTSRYFGFDAGFDRFEDFLRGSRDRLYAGMLDGRLRGIPMSTVFPVRLLVNWLRREEAFKPSSAVYEDVSAWLATATEPYFLWILLMDTHDPYLPPREHRRQPLPAVLHANWRLWRRGHEPPLTDRTHARLRQAYRGTVRAVDAFLDRLRRGLPGDPVIAVHADHGEAFGEHGTYGHHQRLYEENVHVPLVVGGPVPSHTIHRPVPLAVLPDLLSTLAVGDDPLQILPRGPVRTQTLDGTHVGLRGSTWKFIRDPDGESLYNLEADPDERQDVAGAESGLTDACRRLLRSWDADRRERTALAGAARGVMG